MVKTPRLVDFVKYLVAVTRHFPETLRESLGLNLGTLFGVIIYLVVIARYLQERDWDKLTTEWQAWLGLWKPVVVATGIVGALLYLKSAYFLQRETEGEKRNVEKQLADEKARNSDAQILGEILEFIPHGKSAPGNFYRLEGLYVNAKVSFVNDSPARTSIKAYYMHIAVGDQKILSEWATDEQTIDEKPDHELQLVKDGTDTEWVYKNKGRTFDNLNATPIVAEHTVTHVGWLQFYFEGIDMRHLFNGKAYVVMVDHRNEYHPTEPFALLPA